MISSQSSRRSTLSREKSIIYQQNAPGIPNWMKAQQAHQELQDFFARENCGSKMSPQSSCNGSVILEDAPPATSKNQISSGYINHQQSYKHAALNLAKILGEGGPIEIIGRKNTFTDHIYGKARTLQTKLQVSVPLSPSMIQNGKAVINN